MKQADVKLAGVYLTRVSGELVRVLVQGIVQTPQGRRYILCRCTDGIEIASMPRLPKPRSAAALRLPD
jgi:hypothetical protein